LFKDKVMPTQPQQDRASFWFVVRWTVVFAFAYIAALLLYSVLAMLAVRTPTMLAEVSVLGLSLLLSVTLALGQGLVLRPYLRRLKLWMLLTVLGVVGGILAVLVVRALLSGDSVPANVLTGPLVGVLQWLLLRHEVKAAGWWIVANTIAWPLSLIPIMGTNLGLPVTGALTGLVLMWLLNHPKQQMTTNKRVSKGSTS
jgi:hypothetical protein